MRTRLVPVLLSAVLLVGAANLGAYAATGGPLLLGKSNSASKTTKLKTAGDVPALSLESGNAPSLVVSSKVRVKRLNADRVDGYSSTALRTTAYVFTLTASDVTATSVSFPLGVLPNKYLASFSVSASIAGSATQFRCSVSAGMGSPSVTALGQDMGGGNWVVSGSGYIDGTFPRAAGLGCIRTGGTSMTIPSGTDFSAQVVLTKLDNVAVANRQGVHVRASRS